MTTTEVISRRVRELRDRRGRMSAQALADRCAELGMPSLKRQAITNLENGRREAVTVEELLVLAQALDTSPLMLLLPESGTDVAITPESVMDVRQMVLWFAGERGPRGLPTVGFEKDVTLIRWHRAAYDAEQRAKRADQTGRWARRSGDEEAAERHFAESQGHLKDLAGILNTMVDAGMEPPAMNSGWARLMINRGWVENPDAIKVVDFPDLDDSPGGDGQ